MAGDIKIRRSSEYITSLTSNKGKLNLSDLVSIFTKKESITILEIKKTNKT